ncbi:MAG: VanZ family protein [archaeon]
MQKTKAIPWMLVIAYASLIFYMSSRPLAEQPQEKYGFSYINDKFLHVIEFGILSVLLYWALSGRRHALVIAVAAAAIYAATDEIHQLFVPGRSGTVGDFLADCLGAMLPLLKKLPEKWVSH